MIAENECPFCGLNSVEFNGHQMVCQNCGAAGPTHDNKEDALDAWNRGSIEPGRCYRETKY